MLEGEKGHFQIGFMAEEVRKQLIEKGIVCPNKYKIVNLIDQTIKLKDYRPKSMRFHVQIKQEEFFSLERLYAFSGQSLPEKIENEIYISLDPLIYEVIKKEDAKLMTGSAQFQFNRKIRDFIGNQIQVLEKVITKIEQLKLETNEKKREMYVMKIEKLSEKFEKNKFFKASYKQPNSLCKIFQKGQSSPCDDEIKPWKEKLPFFQAQLELLLSFGLPRLFDTQSQFKLKNLKKRLMTGKSANIETDIQLLLSYQIEGSKIDDNFIPSLKQFLQKEVNLNLPNEEITKIIENLFLELIYLPRKLQSLKIHRKESFTLADLYEYAEQQEITEQMRKTKFLTVDFQTAEIQSYQNLKCYCLQKDVKFNRLIRRFLRCQIARLFKLIRLISLSISKNDLEPIQKLYQLIQRHKNSLKVKIPEPTKIKIDNSVDGKNLTKKEVIQTQLTKFLSLKKTPLKTIKNQNQLKEEALTDSISKIEEQSIVKKIKIIENQTNQCPQISEKQPSQSKIKILQ